MTSLQYKKITLNIKKIGNHNPMGFIELFCREDDKSWIWVQEQKRGLRQI